jgi:hypothetical protein
VDGSAEADHRDLMVKCSPTPQPTSVPDTGHVIPSAVRPAHDQRAHDLTLGLKAPVRRVRPAGRYQRRA